MPRHVAPRCACLGGWMYVMTLLQIEVPEELERQLRQEAKRRGVAVGDLACAALRKAVSSEAAPLDSAGAATVAAGDDGATLFVGVQRRRAGGLIALARQQGGEAGGGVEGLLGAFLPGEERGGEVLGGGRAVQG